MIRRFELIRHKDVSGVSGTGLVAEGSLFTDGTVVIRWYGDKPSTVVWSDIDHVIAVHGHGGNTEFRWCDEPAAHPPRMWKEGDRIELGPYVATRNAVNWDCGCGQVHLDGHVDYDYFNGDVKILGGGE